MQNKRVLTVLCLCAVAAPCLATDGSEATASTSSSTETSGSTTSSRSSGSTGSMTTSSESTSSSSKSSSSSSTTMGPHETTATTSTTSTTQTPASVVGGSLSFEVTSGNASDLVDAFVNNTDGSVAYALATSIAAGADGVEDEDVTIVSMELDSDSAGARRLGAAHLRSSRALQANSGIVTQFVIIVPAGQDSAAVAAALTSTDGTAAIEDSLTIELQAVDPTLTIGSVEVVAVALEATTTEQIANSAYRSMTSLCSVALAFCMGSLLPW